MAFREFTDSQGIVWRAWDVTTAQLHPLTRGEDYMGDLQDGWLAFESEHEKRRFAAPYPRDWTELPLPDLESICRQAPPVVARKPNTDSGVHRAYTVETLDRAGIAAGERTFQSPRGREWTVRLHECSDKRGGTSKVLRFTADDVVVDLEQWPDDWRNMAAEQYALLLLDANPPRRPAKGEMPQRRREDRPQEEMAARPRA